MDLPDVLHALSVYTDAELRELQVCGKLCKCTDCCISQSFLMLECSRCHVQSIAGPDPSLHCLRFVRPWLKGHAVVETFDIGTVFVTNDSGMLQVKEILKICHFKFNFLSCRFVTKLGQCHPVVHRMTPCGRF